MDWIREPGLNIAVMRAFSSETTVPITRRTWLSPKKAVHGRSEERDW